MSRSRPQTLNSLLGKTIQSETGCLIWTGAKCSSGYGNVRHSGPVIATHRLVWILTHGNIPNGMCVLHRCDVRACLNIEHLFLGTVVDNNHDRHQKGRYKDRSKLTPELVKTIRSEYNGSISMKKLGRKYGVTAPTVYRALRRQLWKQVI